MITYKDNKARKVFAAEKEKRRIFKLSEDDAKAELLGALERLHNCDAYLKILGPMAVALEAEFEGVITEDIASAAE